MVYEGPIHANLIKSLYIFSGAQGVNTSCQVTCSVRYPDLGTAASGLHVKEADVEKFAG